MMPAEVAMPRLKHAGARVYYAALFLCPTRFRREFSSEMARDLDAAIEEARLGGRRQEMVALWTAIGIDLARTVLVQWHRTGLPILIPCCLIAALTAVRVASQLAAHTALAVPAAAADRDLMTIIIMTGVVLLVIVATILFTFWFSRPLLQRHRR
jgi:hypothetical protein